MGLILVDLSGFRRVNEQYGYAAGDQVLTDLSGKLGSFKRRPDIIFRWGPDEFALLLDNVKPAEVIKMTEQMQNELDVLGYKEMKIKASVGAAVSSPETKVPIDLIEAASRSRYKAKYNREKNMQVVTDN